MTLRPGRVVFAWLLLVASGCSSPASPTGVDATGGASSAAASEMVVLTNAERRQAGLTPFTTSPVLMRAAQIQADQMASAGQMAHVLPGARYPEPADRLAAVGYQWMAYAENVAYGQPSAASAVGAWMGSSGHRANILNPGLTQLGTGIAAGAAGRPYYVQVFGQPR